jgi:ABC-2 type transport system permease protein
MALLFLLYFGFIFVFFEYSNPVTLIEQVNRFYPNIDAYVQSFEPGFLKYLPNHWVAQFFYHIALGEIGLGLANAAVLLSFSIGAFLLCLLVARQFYYRSWLVSLQVQAASSAPYRSDRRRWFDFRSSSLFPPQIEAILKRDYFQFVREPSQWIHFTVMCFLTFIFVFAVGNLNLRLRVVDIQLLTYLVLSSFGAFLTSSIALRFVFPMISLEGMTFWIVLSAPVKTRKLYTVKFILAFVIVLMLSLIVAIATNIPFVRMNPRGAILMNMGLYNAFWISLSVVALNLGFGGFFANFVEKNPIRLASSQGATLTFLASLLYLVAVVAMVVVPLSYYFESVYVFRVFNPRVVIIPGTIIAMLSSGMMGFSWLFGLNSLRRDF